MSRAFSFLVAWAIAAAVASVIAWQGVSLVGDQVTTSRPAALDRGDVEARLADASPTTAPRDATTTVPTVPGATPAPERPAIERPVTEQPGRVATTTTRPAQPASPGAPGPTTVAVSPSPTTTVAQASEVRTYNLVGGTASLRFSPSGVTVEYATPKAGFTVDVEPEHGNGVKVEFESADHRSRVDGWWDGGPQQRVREEPRSGSGSGSDD